MEKQQQREWAYKNLTPLYSYPELANMDDDELQDLIDSQSYECPDCGELHDGATSGTEWCPSCEQDRQ